MSFFCPTFQRPKRLMELANSWDEHARGMPLFVRVWDKDPHKEEYLDTKWPDEWTLYESSAEWTAEALQEFFEKDRERDYYGFIGDDIVLESRDAIGNLVREAGNIYIAYPNDRIQRHNLSTHFCIGGDLVRTVGYLCPPGFKHHYLDQVWHTIGLNTGLLRYRPDVIFNHKHVVRGKAEMDATYQRVYVSPSELRADREKEAREIFQLWLDKRAGRDIGTIKRKFLHDYEGYSLEEIEEMLNER
jgi:hypothetical protein